MEIYHALNRGVDKRTIFLDSRDYARFVHDMYEFNDEHPAPDTYRTMWDLRNPTLARKRKMIVDIHGWCLMKNHYHLLLSERREGGLSLFLRKLNVGYANYFNERYTRSGTLFQGRTKKIRIASDAHFLHILHYIHLNPLDYVPGAKQWRLGDVRDRTAAKSALGRYRWSSYNDYVGKKNFPSIIRADFMRSSLGNIEKKTMEYIEDIDLSTISSLPLE